MEGKGVVLLHLTHLELNVLAWLNHVQVSSIIPGVILLQCPQEACPPHRYFQVEVVLFSDRTIVSRLRVVDWAK